MKRAVITLALLTVTTSPCVVAHAEPTLGNRVDATKDSITSAASNAKESAADSADSARERAAEVAEQAKEKSSEVADGLRERYDDVNASVREYAGTLADGARDKVDAIGGTSKDAVAHTKTIASDAVQGVIDYARATLIGWAVSLDNRSRDARKAARAASWEKLKQRFNLAGDRPTMEMSEELLQHEFLVAQIRRVQELARAVGDEKTLRASDQLLERQYLRHRRQVEKIRDKERANDRRTKQIELDLDEDRRAEAEQ